MDGKNERLPDSRSKRSIRKALVRMMHDIRNEPQIILEIGDYPESKEPLDDILTWLFRRREDDETANN